MVLGINQGIGGCVLGMGKTMGRVSRLETVENTEFSKSVKFFWTFWEPKNGLKMNFLVISSAETLHTLRYKPGKHFWNLVGDYFLFNLGSFPKEFSGKFPRKFAPNSPLLIPIHPFGKTGEGIPKYNLFIPTQLE